MRRLGILEFSEGACSESSTQQCRNDQFQHFLLLGSNAHTLAPTRKREMVREGELKRDVEEENGAEEDDGAEEDGMKQERRRWQHHRLVLDEARSMPAMHGQASVAFTSSTTGYEWPGCVRELRQARLSLVTAGASKAHCQTASARSLTTLRRPSRFFSLQTIS